MPWYTYILLGIYIICCFILISVVLLQSGKGDIASAFGGGGSQTAFGPRSAASTLSRVTMFAAATFMILSFVFTLPGVMNAGSVAYGIKDEPAAVKPVTPSPAPVASPGTNPAPAASPAPAGQSSPAPVTTPGQPAPAISPAPAGAEKPATTPAKPAEPAAKPAEPAAKPADKPAETKPADKK